jgi:adenosylcobyric acid synthase
LGICGGYQMLGQSVSDPDGIEGPPGTTAGLGHLDVHTTMTGNKTLTKVRARHVQTGLPISGYEIHIGRTSGPDCARPFAMIDEGAHVTNAADGARSISGQITGSYLHGMFCEDAFRAQYLSRFGLPTSTTHYGATVEATLDALAAHLEVHLDIDGLLGLAR